MGSMQYITSAFLSDPMIGSGGLARTICSLASTVSATKSKNGILWTGSYYLYEREEKTLIGLCWKFAAETEHAKDTIGDCNEDIGD